MFNNIGGKIKGLAKFIFWVLAILSVISGMLIIIQGFGSSRSESVVVSILIGLAVMVLGILMAWLQNFLLYGFGELVDSNQKILKELERRNFQPIGQQTIVSNIPKETKEVEEQPSVSLSSINSKPNGE